MVLICGSTSIAAAGLKLADFKLRMQVSLFLVLTPSP